MKFTGGLPETACGYGSTLRATTELRAKFPGLLAKCEITSLVDAPCGDGNWISNTALNGIAYHGIDASTDNVQKAISRECWPGFEPRRQTFERGDLLTMVDLPPADAIMCREFFQHIPNIEITSFLTAIFGSGYDWLLATSFNCETNVEIGPEQFRPVNLQAEPYNLGKPAFEIPDPPGSGRILGAWRL